MRPSAEVVSGSAEPGSPDSGRAQRFPPAPRWEYFAFVGALAVYAITRFWRLGDYPIYFFCDEAFQPVAAEELLQRGFRDTKGRLFPLYFTNGAWVPLFPVWLHVFTVALFGKSVEVARATSAAVSLLGAAAIALVLRYGFRSRLWWAGPLALAVIPAHFLHSRTTFETAFSTAFFACFLLFYVLYRTASPGFLYPTVLFGAFSFYSYSVGQLIVAVAALLLAIVDLPYHARNWRHVLAGLALAAVLFVPLYRFRRLEPQAATGQLARVSSYWVEPIPLLQKARKAVRSYGRAVSPKYWFVPNERDYRRHRLAGYAHIPMYLLPFAAIGLLVCLWRFRSPPHRTVLVAGLAAPAGALLTATGITRALSFVVPVAILAMVGTDTIFRLIRPPKARVAAALLVFALPAFAAMSMLRDALVNGPYWYRDYAWGQQWGARQIFDVVRGYLKRDPKVLVKLTSEWANGADTFPRFFLKRGSPEAKRVGMGNVLDFESERMASLPSPILAAEIERVPRTIYVMTPRELETAKTSEAISLVQVDQVLNYPDGTPGFYFARLTPSPAIKEIVARGREKLHALVDGSVEVDGRAVSVRHTRLDIGRLEDLVDGNLRSLARFNGTNPAILELHFTPPRPLREVRLALTAGSWNVRLELVEAESAGTRSYEASRSGVRDFEMEVPIDRGPVKTAVLRIEIRQVDAGDFAIVHLRELELR
ncbi:MAG TPA: hypothetical protein VLG15_02715 [Thermoanaerobaculia bacterium]|nr:hypothetical protein [Thermoanaerobaculia bacterium]